MDASKYKKDFKQTFVYVLKATTKIGDFKHDDINDFFRESYKDIHNEYHQMFLSLINSVFTHMSKTFIMSRSSAYHMCYHDSNVPNKIKLHANNYSTFLSFCFEKGYIKRLREPTGRRGGVYQIVDAMIVKKLNEIQGKMFFKEQEEYVINAYDSNESLDDFSDFNEMSLPGTKEERRAKLVERISKQETEE